MKRSIVIPLIMFAFILSIFYISPPQPPSDSYYTLLVSETLLTKGRLWLDDCFKQPLNPGRYPGINETGYPYQVEIKRGHIYNSYPLGNAFLCVPIAAVAKMMGYSFHFKNGVYHAANEERVQQIAASFLMAFLCLVWYRTANRFLPDSWSVGIAIVMTLGTSVWSTLSRALWMDTWGILIQSLVIDRFVAVRISGARFRPLLVATLCSWSFMIKPTYCIFIVVISIYILMVHRVHFLSFASTGVFWLGVFIGSSLWNNGQILPSENTNATFLFRWQNIPEGFAGILISPARGLFVYSPMLLVAGYLLIKYWKKLPLHDLTKTALLFSALHVFLVSSYALWWAGFSYGPRYMAPL